VIFRVPSNIQLWEAIAVVQILQQLNKKAEPRNHWREPSNVTYVALAPDLTEDTIALFQLAGVGSNVKKYDGSEKEIDLIQAYGSTATSDMYYGQVLARENGIQVMPLAPSRFPFVKPGPAKKGIVVCPFGLRPEFDVPIKIWKEVIRQLESYDSEIYILGERGQRLDEIGFTENEILSDLPLSDKLQAIASAKLIVGVANSWTWASSAWPVKRILIHPDTVRNDRWYPGVDNSMTKFLLTNSDILEAPVILVGIRKMMKEL
jgi:hypothetical protein